MEDFPTHLPTKDRQAAFVAIADAIAGRMQKVDAEQNQSLEVQFSPEKSLMGLMLQEAQGFRFYFHDEEDNNIHYGIWGPVEKLDVVGFWDKFSRDYAQAVHGSKWGKDIYNEQGQPVVPTEVREYAALSYARKVLAKSDKPVDRLKSVLMPAFIAANRKPEDWDSTQKPKKHKHETEDEALFRIAWHDLTKIAGRGQGLTRDVVLYRKVRNRYRNDPDANWDEFEEIMHSPENQDLRDGHVSLWIGGCGVTLKKLISDPAFTADLFREECFQLRRLRDQRREPASVPAEETIWTILPPGTLEETGEGIGNGGETQHFVDPERMKWLARLAISWGKEAYIAVANLDKTGNYDYRVAVLPQRKERATIEHVVAENPSSGNAIYVFRAERGLGKDSTPWLTWRDVLSDTKSGARALGARRILHGVFVDENVLEYLTRPDEDIDKSNYNR